MYGQRNIPCVLDFCKDIREVAKDDVLFLNYANPNAMNTWAAIEYGKVNTVGLCHGVQGGHHQIANGRWAPRTRRKWTSSAPASTTRRGTSRSSTRAARSAAEELLAAFERHPAYRKTEKVRIDVLRRFGYYTTESNGHLSRVRAVVSQAAEAKSRKWIDLSSWINGETGGYLRVCTEGRNWFETDFPQLAEGRGQAHRPGEPLAASTAATSSKAWRPAASTAGTSTSGTTAASRNLPDDCIVEVPGYVDRNGISIPRVGDLPLACAATLSASINVQRMAVQAAVDGDVTLLKQAMLHDPLTAAVCDPEEIWQMADEMLVAQAKWLPQYRDEIAAAKKRLAKGKRLGTSRSKGAARLKVRTPAELKRKVKPKRVAG